MIVFSGNFAYVLNEWSLNMKPFPKIVNSLKQFIIFAKSSIIDIWQEYSSKLDQIPHNYEFPHVYWTILSRNNPFFKQW